MNTVQNITQPAYVAADKLSINCMVQFDSFPQPIPFTASLADAEQRGRDIYDALIAGKYGAIGNYVAYVPTLAQAQTTQIALISASCGAAIIVGASSSALGLAYTYPTKTLDQANLNAAVTASIIPSNASNWTAPLICQSATGVWAYVPHSAAQVQKVGQDLFAQISAMLVKNATLAGQVNAAASVAAVQLIAWS